MPQDSELITQLNRQLLARVGARLRGLQMCDESFRALRASEERYRTLANAVNSGIWSAAPNGDIVGEAHGWEEMTGQTAEEYRGGNWIAAVHPDDRQQVLDTWHQAVRDGTSVEVDFRVRRHDGSYHYIRSQGAPIHNPDGTVREWIGTIRDIDERRRALEALRTSEEEFRANFELAGIGQAQLDPSSGRIWRVNPRFCEMLGYSAEELLAKTFWDITHPEDLPRNHASVQPFLHGETSQFTIEKRFVRKDGSILWGLVTATMIRDAEGRPLRSVAMIQDITDRRQSEALERAAREQAESANRVKDEFLAVVSHELRTPLTAITGWVHLLLEGKLDDAARLRALQTIQRQARSQRQIIDDLLDVSRIVAAGKLRLELRDVEPCRFINAAIDVVRPTADAKNIHLVADVDTATGTVAGDPNRLQQVIWNLLSNAIKFTPEGGRVEIRSRWVDSAIEIVVADTGQGISEDFLPYVFDRFRQADVSTTRAHGGLGLGLAIVRHLIEIHGGTVRAESAGRGKGATFTIRLPGRAVRSDVQMDETFSPCI